MKNLFTKLNACEPEALSEYNNNKNCQTVVMITVYYVIGPSYFQNSKWSNAQKTSKTQKVGSQTQTIYFQTNPKQANEKHTTEHKTNDWKEIKADVKENILQ